jgi:oxaloacetate decarboxylase gamma subunit
MQGSIVTQGVELMLFGMGTVLVFLTVLVLAIALMSWVLRRYFPEPETDSKTNRPRGSAAAPATAFAAGDATLVAVISAALHRHRSNRHDR